MERGLAAVTNVIETNEGEDAACPIEGLISHVPPLVVEWMVEHPQTAVPEMTAFPGLVLFTDIAGFTHMTETMDGAGPSGIEELSRLLNDYFAGLVEIVAEHGGKVMKFAGDALIAVWRCAETVDRDTTLSVAAAALRIQANTHRFAKSAGLSMKASIGCGEVLHFVLGAEANRSSLIAGAAMEEARAAMQRAKAGEVIAGPRVASFVSGESVEIRAGGFLRVRSMMALGAITNPQQTPLIPGEEARAALLQHVPVPLRGRLAAGQSSWLAEFRRVSVVFLNVPDMRLDRGSAEQLQGAIRALQAIFARHGCAIENLAEDHEGLTLVAAFGLPHMTYENDAVRAVRGALAARRELRNLGFGSGIGITTGRLFCGLIGGPRRSTYSLVGDSMNRCARFMRLAENDVFCDGATQNACARQVEFEFLRTIPLRGRTGQVRVFRPLADGPVVTLAEMGIVGRIEERGRIRGRIRALVESASSGVMIVEGEAGIGKTTLAMEARALAESHGLRIFSGSGDAIEQTASYRPWHEVFASLLDLRDSDGEEDREEQVLARLTEVGESPVSAPLLNPVLGFRFPENEITSRMTGRPRADATSSLLVRIFSRVLGSERAVVVLEDCHWFDSASWNVAAELHRHVPGLLLFLVTRPPGEPKPEEWRWLLSEAGRDRIVLGALSPENTVAVACRALKVCALPPEVSEILLEKTGGHPFFAGEFARALRDAGHLLVEGETCRLAPGAEDLRHSSFPSSADGVVRERLDRLSLSEQLAIKAASVIGPDFDLSTLRAIQPEAEDLAASLHSLVERDLLQHRAVGEEYLAFKHAIIQDVAYHQLTFSRRRELHCAVAQWNEQHDPSNYSLLAHHWKFGQAAAKALHYLDLAAGEAIGRFANREAASLIEDAISLSAESGHRPERLTAGRWRRQLGEAHFHLGRIDRSREVLREATAILGHAMPETKRHFAFAMPHAIFRQLRHRAGEWLLGQSALEKDQEILEAIRAYNLLGEIAFFTNDLPSSLFCTVRGLNLAELLGPSPSLAEMYAAMVIVTAAMPVRAFGKGYRALTERVLSSVSEPVSHAYSRELIGIYLNGLGEWDEAERMLEKAARTFLQYGHGRRREECLLNIAYGHLYRGDFARACLVHEEMRSSAMRRRDFQTMGWVRLLAAELRLSTEGPRAALETIEENRHAEHLDGLTRAGSEALAALAMFQIGEPDRSLKSASLALRLLTEGPPVAYTMMLYTAHIAEALIGLLARSRGAERAGFRKLARRACASAVRFGRVFPVGRPRALLLEGAIDFVEGHPALAKVHWRNSEEAARELGMEHEAACARVHMEALTWPDNLSGNRARLCMDGIHFSLAHLTGSP